MGQQAEARQSDATEALSRVSLLQSQLRQMEATLLEDSGAAKDSEEKMEQVGDWAEDVGGWGQQLTWLLGPPWDTWGAVPPKGDIAPVHGSMGPWVHGSMGPWVHGSFGKCETMVPWCYLATLLSVQRANDRRMERQGLASAHCVRRTALPSVVGT